MRYASVSDPARRSGRRSASVAPVGLGRSDVRAQFLWYVLVGGLSFLTDLAAFAALVAAGAPVMGALALGFAVGTLANYLLSRALAFTGGRFGRADEVLRLVVVALAGLALTAALVAGFMALGLAAITAKVAATPIALAWNYLGRRLFVFHAEMPGWTWRLSDRAAARTRRMLGAGRRDG
jgi:putative flippase GtrA